VSKRYLTEEDGILCVTAIVGNDADGNKLTKVLFEMSRTTDLATHFDSTIHTRAAISSGIAGHRPLSLLGECDHADLPTDLYFRDAWEWRDDSININLTKARVIHLAVIREVRNSELAALDVTFRKYLQAGDTEGQATIATVQQVLRDIPQTFDLTARTPAQLKAQWPSELPPRTA